MLPTSRARILIADDEPANTRLLQRVMQPQHDAIAVNSGREAMQFLQQEPFDLVLLDIMMPDMSGFDILKAVRQTYAPHDLPVILISALANVEDITYGLELMANDYITKPIDIDIVKTRVQTQLYLKQMADERKQLIDKLERANTIKQSLLRIASHDLKNPLGSLVMIHYLLGDHIKDNSEAANLLAMADQNTHTMLTLIEEFLDLDILKDGDISVDMQSVNLQAVIDRVLIEYDTPAIQKGITIQVIQTDEFVCADAKRLKQVIGNLVSNAIKYSPPHTRVQIVPELRHDCLALHVIDQGEGIPERERGQLFKAFSKISTQPTAGENSTGLGLWIVKEMMTAMNGDVSVHCPPEGGSDFYITLPVTGRVQHEPAAMLA